MYITYRSCFDLCQVRFYKYRPRTRQGAGRPSGKCDVIKESLFVELCNYLDSHETGQFTMSDIMGIIRTLAPEQDEVYCAKYLKEKLIKHYGKELILTTDPGKETVYTFLDIGNRVLRENHYKSGLSRDDTIKMAATLIADDIKTKQYDLSKYPKFENMSENQLIPESLSLLLNELVKSKATVKASSVERKRIAIGHSIIAAMRPRSFVSPILLAISVYVNTKLESRELVDVLSSLSFADDYRELSRLHDALMPTEKDIEVLLGDLGNFIFDNADIDIRTLTGLGTWHVMGGIAASTPRQNNVETDIPRSTKTRSASEISQFSQIPIKKYTKSPGIGINQVVIGPLEPPKKQPPILKLAKTLDDMWLSSFSVLLPLQVKCPNWSGFMQVAVKGQLYETSSIQILPFINLDPTKLDTIYSALCFAQDQIARQDTLWNGVDQNNKMLGAVTFDQPLYAKAYDIIKASSDLDRIILRLGGFHLLMSYMGSIGFIMKGSGLKCLCSTVYAPKSVDHMLTGHAYARALRCHFLNSAALTKLMIEENPGCLNGVNLQKLRDIHQLLINEACETESVLNEVAIKQFTQILDDLATELSNQCRTSKLWVNYMRQIQILRLFIYGERTGDFDLHLYSLAHMIPILHAAGHLAYARSARCYLDAMKELPDIMGKDQFMKFTEGGYFTIRRSDIFWNGNFTDQTIEQVLMRLLKAVGGVAHGRGITPSTQARLVHTMPKCVPICNALENFCDVHTHRSEQHKDLRASSTARDSTDFNTLFTWLKSHSPFSYHAVDGLVNIATGVIADKSANAEQAYDIGKALADEMTGKKHGDVKIKRNDRVTSINAAVNAVEVRGKKVEVNSTLLFMRVTCIIKSHEEMAEYLQYEFATFPPAMFDKGLMRKNTKSDLASVLKKNVKPIIDTPHNAHYVADGGHIIQMVIWPSAGTYNDVCESYVEYVKKHFGDKITIVFDGYDDPLSTKVAEQERRVSNNVSAQIVFNGETVLCTTKKDFLNNRKNKSHFIQLLITRLKEANISCQQSSGDADQMISSTALTCAAEYHCPVILVGNDTDILAILIDQMTQAQDIYMQFSTSPVSMYSIADIQRSISTVAKEHLLVAHAITGCDTTSSLYGLGKKRIITLLNSDKYECSSLEVFKKDNSSHDQIKSAGEQLMLKLYGATKSNTLDKYRHVLYKQKVSRKSLSSDGFQLEGLPPTSAAAKFHSYRTYHAVQEWLGNEIRATDWGWYLKDGRLLPIVNDKEPAPQRVLKIISCACQKGCNARCKCRRYNMECTEMCASCLGQSCKNSVHTIDHDDN